MSSTSQLLEVAPSSAQEVSSVAENAEMIQMLSSVEGGLLALLVVDMILKLINHFSIIQIQDPHVNQKIVNGKAVTKPASSIYNAGFIEINNQVMLSTATLIMDVVLFTCLVVLYLVEFWRGLEMSYLVLSILLVSRFYLRIPFTVALLIHQH